MSPFENINDSNRPRSNLFKMFLYSVMAFGLLAVTGFNPLLGIIGLALIIIPPVRLMLEGRIWESIFCSIAGSGILFFLDAKIPFLFMAFLIIVSFVFRYCHVNNKEPFLIIVFTGTAFIVLLLIFILSITFFLNPDFISGFLNSYRETIANLSEDPLIQTYIKVMAITPEQMQATLKQVSSFLNLVPYLVPGVLVFGIFSASFLGYYWSMIIFRKNGIVLKKLPLFKAWDLPWYFIAGLIVGLLLVLIPHSETGAGFLINIIGINLLIIFGLIYTFMGFAVLFGLFEKFKITLFWRILIILSIIFFMILLIIVPIIGILDAWINFRKLERR